MSEKETVFLSMLAKQKSLEGQLRALNPRDKDYKIKAKIINDKIRRIPFDFGLNSEKKQDEI